MRTYCLMLMLSAGCLDLKSLQSGKAAPPSDGGAMDAAPADAESGLRLGPSPGCELGMGFTHPDFPKVTACPGAFDPALAAGQCRTPFRLCPTAPPAAFCGQLSGFFAGAQPVAQSAPWPPDSTLRCAWEGSTATSPRGIAGCGQVEGVYESVLVQCQGFKMVQPCGSGGWNCPGVSDSEFLNISNMNAGDGVLCCRS